MKKETIKYVAGLICLLLVLSLTGGAALAGPVYATAPGLGAAGSFSVLAAQTMTSANTTTISGDLGLYPGTSVTGPWVVGGTEHVTDALAQSAQAGALVAFNTMAGLPSTGTWGPVSLTPGVWAGTGSPVFAGTLTLDGGANDVWIFQISTDFTFSGSIVMAGGAQPCNVFWEVARDATIASGSSFVGTLIASRDITLVSGATVNGRVMSLNGALTTDNNRITGPSCASATATPAPTDTLVPTATLIPTSTPTGTLLPPTPTSILPSRTPGPTKGPSPTALPSITPVPACASGWPLIGEGFVNGKPASNMLLRFNLAGWGYQYWESKTGANGWTPTNRFDQSVTITGAYWQPSVDYPAGSYVLDHVTISGGKWGVSGGNCANMEAKVYIVSAPAQVSTPTALPFLPVTGVNETPFYLFLIAAVLAVAGVLLTLTGLVEKKH